MPRLRLKLDVERREAGVAPDAEVVAHVHLVAHTRNEHAQGAAGLHTGVALQLRREPAHQYDKNAIAVDVPGSGMAGYVMGLQAAVLAPALDARPWQVFVKSATLEGMPSSTDSRASLPVESGKYCLPRHRMPWDKSKSRWRLYL
jgi:hypothetical protein